MATTEPNAREATDPTAPARHHERTASRPRRWIWPTAFAVGGLILFAAYERQAGTAGINSDGASQALQAWDMLHGNLLLHGWTLTDVSFYTTELPEFVFVEWIRGLGSDVLHITAALTYTLVVLLAAWLAKGRATGAEGTARVLVAAGIMLAPSLGGATTVLLHDPDHTGTQVPLLVIWLILDRTRPRWQVPAVVTVLLFWAQVADQVVTYEGVLPLAFVCAIRLYRRRHLAAGRDLTTYLRGSWYELSLAVGAIASAGMAAITLSLIRQVGGFTVLPLSTTFAPVRFLFADVWSTVQSVLTLFGASFTGSPTGFQLGISLVHLAGVALAAWAVTRALRRFTVSEPIVQVLAVAVIVLLAAYIIRSQQNAGPHEIVGVLPIGAVLAGRLAAAAVSASAGRRAVSAIVLACYAGTLAYSVLQPAPPDPNRQLADWLRSHDLTSGLAAYWNADIVTFYSRDRVQVTPVYRFAPGHFEGINRSSKVSWFSPAEHDARFLVLPAVVPGCAGGTPGQWLLTARTQFGAPAASYQVGPFRVLVWHANLLKKLVEAPPGNPC
jgi:hypothetical protein